MLDFLFRHDSFGTRLAGLQERIVALEVDFRGLCRKFEDLEEAWATHRGRKTKTAALDEAATQQAETEADRVNRSILERRARGARALSAGG
jgi:hypothetical protein